MTPQVGFRIGPCQRIGKPVFLDGPLLALVSTYVAEHAMSIDIAAVT